MTRALSGGEDPEVDVTELNLLAGERFLLCSDGLFSVVTDPQITQILADKTLPLADVCRRLIDAANNGGGPDNITAVVVEVDVP